MTNYNYGAYTGESKLTSSHCSKFHRVTLSELNTHSCFQLRGLTEICDTLVPTLVSQMTIHSSQFLMEYGKTIHIHVCCTHQRDKVKSGTEETLATFLPSLENTRWEYSSCAPPITKVYKHCTQFIFLCIHLRGQSPPCMWGNSG